MLLLLHFLAGLLVAVAYPSRARVLPPVEPADALHPDLILNLNLNSKICICISTKGETAADVTLELVSRTLAMQQAYSKIKRK